MRVLLHLSAGIIICGLIIGCTAARKQIIDVTPEENPDAFVFVESPLMTITADMMAERFNQDQLPYMIKKIDSVTAWKTVYNMLLDSALYRRADTFDLAEHKPLLYSQFRRRVQNRIIRTLFDVEVYGKMKPDSEVIRQAYEDNLEKFLIPEQYRARHIVISGPGLRESDSTGRYSGRTTAELDSLARQKIDHLRKLVLEGHSFDSLAQIYSQDPSSSSRGGDLGYFQLSQMVEPFDSVVEHTPQGEVSKPVKTKYGWHIVIVDDFSPEHHLPLDSAWAGMEQQYMEHMGKFRGQEFQDSVIQASTLALDTALLSVPDTVYEGSVVFGVANPDDTLHGCDTLLAEDYYQVRQNYLKAKGIHDRALTLDERIDVANAAAIKLDLLKAARDLGVTEREDFVKWRDNLYHGYAIVQMRQALLDNDYTPSDKKIEKYYDNHLDEFVVEKPIYVQHIVFADSNYAEYVRDMALSGQDFLELAKQYYPGDPDIREVAADLGYISKDEMPIEFWQEANRTPVGEISHPVHTQYGYHIIKVVDKKYSLSLTDATPRIRTALIHMHNDDRLRRIVHRLLRGKPEIHFERVDALYRKPLPPMNVSGTTP